MWKTTAAKGILARGRRQRDHSQQHGTPLSKSSGIFVATLSKDTEIYGNTLEDNDRGIQFFLPVRRWEAERSNTILHNVYAHDNSVKVYTQ